MVSVMPQQPIKIFPDDLSEKATGRFQCIKRKNTTYKKRDSYVPDMT